jgi:hypothetical protein
MLYLGYRCRLDYTLSKMREGRWHRDIIEENEKLEASESESDMMSIPIMRGE